MELMKLKQLFQYGRKNIMKMDQYGKKTKSLEKGVIDVALS